MKHCPFVGTGEMTLEPDGTATGCNPVEVGSTPTGVSDRSTAGSDYITQKLMSELNLRRMVTNFAQLPAGSTSTPCYGVPKGTTSR